MECKIIVNLTEENDRQERRRQRRNKVTFSLQVRGSGYIEHTLNFPIPPIETEPDGEMEEGTFYIGNDPETPEGTAALKVVRDNGCGGMEEHASVTADEFLRLLADRMGYDLTERNGRKVHPFD